MYLEGLAPCGVPRVGVVTGTEGCNTQWATCLGVGRQNEKVNARYIWDLGVQMYKWYGGLTNWLLNRLVLNIIESKAEIRLEVLEFGLT